MSGNWDTAWESLPLWVQFLSRGLMLFSLMSCSAVILSKAGKNSYWALFTVIPYFVVVAIWFFAWSEWPKADDPA